MSASDAPAEKAAQKVVLRLMLAADGRPPESRFGDRMKDARLQLDLSVEALSRLAKSYDFFEGKGISPPTLGRYEANETLPSLRELRLISESLDVPVEWLVHGSLSDSKESAQSQALVIALRGFIEYVRDDISIGGIRASQVFNIHQGIDRERMLADAKRPNGAE